MTPRTSDHGRRERFTDWRCHARPFHLQPSAQTNGIPCSTMLASKPAFVSGRPDTRYVALKSVPYGVRSAYESIWGQAIV